MNLLETLIRIYAPFRCLGCESETDKLICDSCVLHVPRVPSRCYRCLSVTRDFAVCRACRHKTPLRHVYVATHYHDLPKELLHAAKYERARAGLEQMATLCAPLLSLLPPDIRIIPVPTASSRVRRRGYDQAIVFARHLAKQNGGDITQVLQRFGQAHQVGANRVERIAHLQDALRVVKKPTIQNTHLLLVDDVLTTGATLETAARLLKKAGARQVDALVFSQPT